MSVRTRRTAAAAIVLLGLSAGVERADALTPGQLVPLGELQLPDGVVTSGDAAHVGQSETVATSADGRYVAFTAVGALAPGAPLDTPAVVRKDRATGELTLVSRATGPAGAPGADGGDRLRISDDGTRVAWRTRDALSAADDDADADVYVRDLVSQTTTLASPAATGAVGGLDLAGNGGVVVYAAASLFGSTVSRYQLSTQTTTTVSVVAGSTAAALDVSGSPSVSDDGRYVAFDSNATSLVPGFVDHNGALNYDVYVRDTFGNSTTLASGPGGSATDGANGLSFGPRLAGAPASGWTVAFTSRASDLDAAATDDDLEVYRRPSGGSAALVSRTSTTASGGAVLAGIDDTGGRVLLRSASTVLGSAVFAGFLRDVTGGGSTTRITPPGPIVAELVLADDGVTTVWSWSGGGAADADPQLRNVLARTGSTGPVTLVSRPPGTARPVRPVAETATRIGLGDAGRYAAFVAASPLLPGGSDSVAQAYRRDVRTGALTLVSRADGADGAPGVGAAANALVGADGSRVAFTTEARLSPADADTLRDVYVRDLGTQTTTLASRADGAGGADADRSATLTAFTPDGRFAVFATTATTLEAGDGTFSHVYRRDLATGATVLVDRGDGPAGAPATASSGPASVSDDGNRIAFESRAPLVAPDAGTDESIYVRDVGAGTTVLASRAGAAGASVPEVEDPAISGDGTAVAFTAADAAILPGSAPWTSDQIVLRDLASGENRLVSRGPGGGPGDRDSGEASLGTAPGVVAFATTATGLAGGDGQSGVVVADLAAGTITGPPAFGRLGFGSASAAVLSPDGACLGFLASGHVADGTGADWRTPYLWARTAACAAADPAPPGVVPPPGPGVVQPGVARPVLSRVRLSRSRFRVGPKRTAVTAGRRRTPTGTTLRFRLSAAATVTARFERRTTGRKAGKRCVKPTRRTRGRKACVRWVAAGTLTRRGVRAGDRAIAFSGRVGRRKLAVARHRLTVRAANTGGRSARVRVPFRVARR